MCWAGLGEMLSYFCLEKMAEVFLISPICLGIVLMVQLDRLTLECLPGVKESHCAEFEATDYAPCSSFITSATYLCSPGSWKCLPWLWSGEALKTLLLLAGYSMKGDAWQGNAFRSQTSN